MTAAGVLLTGGRSHRMGDDKAVLPAPGAPDETLAGRTGRILKESTAMAVEVGPGRSGLTAVVEPHPGSGPLPALAWGATTLREMGWDGPVVVLATDLPRITPRLVAWLADHPDTRSVVPIAGDRPQTLCARYSVPDLDVAIELAEAGRRSMRDLIDSIGALMIHPHEWMGVAGDIHALQDVDTPEDLHRMGQV